MHQWRCYLDMDGVLTDVMADAARWHGIQNPYATNELAGSYDNFYHKVKMTRDQYWGSLPFEFWAGLTVTVEAHEIVRIAESTFDDVWILTSPEANPACVAGKEEWCRRHFPQFAEKVIADRDKWKYANRRRVLVDDHDANVDIFRQSGGQSVQVPRMWNRLHALQHDPMPYVRAELEKIR